MNKSTKTQQIERVELDQGFNPLLITMGQYEFFMSNGKTGIEAMTLFIHLMYTARLQQTNQVWASNQYLKNGLSLGENKVKQLKSWLKDKGLIEYAQRRDPDTGQMGKTYIRLKYIHKAKTIEKIEKTTGGMLTAPPVNRTTGNERQMLKANKLNALNKQANSKNTPARPARSSASCDVAPSFDAPGGEREEVTKEEKQGNAVFSLMQELQDIQDTRYSKQIAASVLDKVEDWEKYLDYVNFRVVKKEGKNPAGMFLKAIRDDWYLEDYENATGPSWETTRETVRNKCPVCELHRKESYLIGGMCGTCGYSPGHSREDEEKHRKSSEELWQGRSLVHVEENKSLPL